MERVHEQIDAEIAEDAESELYSPAELARKKSRTPASVVGLSTPLLRNLQGME